MSTEVDQIFTKQYEDQVHAAYQRMGSKLRNFVRTSTKVPGQDITFPKIGKGTAKTKPRNGPVEPMNLGHSSVTVTLSDYYAPDYIDVLDQLKTNVDLQNAYAEAAAYALGRQTDTQITTALDEVTTNTDNVNLSAITTLRMNQWLADLGDRDVPIGDGNVFVAVSPQVWAKLMSLQEFTSSDWLGPEDLPFKTRMEAKYWNGATWCSFTGLPGTASARKCYAWHRNAIGHGIHHDVRVEINYVPERVSFLVNAIMSMGAIMIDNDGIQEIIFNETA